MCVFVCVFVRVCVCVYVYIITYVYTLPPIMMLSIATSRFPQRHVRPSNIPRQL